MESGVGAKRKSREPETNIEDKGIEERAMEELEMSACSCLMELKRLKEESDNRENEHSQSLEEGERIRKIMGSAIESILKNMLKLVDECNIKGFVYGIIPEKGKSISAASENLHQWWKEKVNFNRNGRFAILKYKEEKAAEANKEELDLNVDSYAPLKTLHKLSDYILEIILSCLILHCNPPWNKIPPEGGIPPSWWPKGDEEWWPLMGFDKNLGPPPYKKPHHLKKTWKVAILVGVIKNMSPDIQNIRNILHQCKRLQAKISAKETASLAAVLNHEEILANPIRLSDMLHETNDDDDVEGNDIGTGKNNIVEEHHNQLHNANLVQTEANVQQNSQVIRPIGLKRTIPMGNEIYTCDSPQCPYSNYHNGFHDKGMRDYHHVNCPFRDKYFQMPQVEQVLMKTTTNSAYVVPEMSLIICNMGDLQNNIVTSSSMVSLMDLNQQPQIPVNINLQQQNP